MKKAFTLLEMLVVIGIIMILVSLISSSYSTAQKKARDSRRKSDLAAIQNAMEQYYSICGYQYPISITGIICPSPSTAIMPTVPADPLTTPYVHSPNTASEYKICTYSNLETEAAKYCVSNQQ